jgi:hypothetical protein
MGTFIDRWIAQLDAQRIAPDRAGLLIAARLATGLYEHVDHGDHMAALKGQALADFLNSHETTEEKQHG